MLLSLCRLPETARPSGEQPRFLARKTLDVDASRCRRNAR